MRQLDVRNLLAVRFGPLACFAQFVLVGLSGLAVDLSTQFLLLKTLPLPLAGGLAIWTAMSWNFQLNRRLTFADAASDSAFRQYIRFCASCLLGAAVNWSARVGMQYLHPFFADHPSASVIVGVAGGTVFNYLLCRHLVFKPCSIDLGPSDEQGQPAEAVVETRLDRAA